MANTNIYGMTDTWNNAGVVFTGIQMNVTDTASQASSLLLDLQVGGSSKFSVRKDGVVTALNVLATTLGNITSGNAISSSAGYWNTAFTSQLIPSAANLWEQQNGINAQIFRVYNTFTDASNYRRLAFDLNSTLATLRTEGAGTGAGGLPLDIRTVGANVITFSTSNSTRWQLDASGNLGPFVDNSFDLGTSGGRVRNLYMGSWLRMASSTVAALPAAATAGANARMFVTDASAPAFGATVVGGGAVLTPVYSDGSNWKVG